MAGSPEPGLGDDHALVTDDRNPRTGATEREPLKVLVVDGEASLRQSLSLYLESLGCEVEQVPLLPPASGEPTSTEVTGARAPS